MLVSGLSVESTRGVLEFEGFLEGEDVGLEFREVVINVIPVGREAVQVELDTAKGGELGGAARDSGHLDSEVLVGEERSVISASLLAAEFSTVLPFRQSAVASFVLVPTGTTGATCTVEGRGFVVAAVGPAWMG